MDKTIKLNADKMKKYEAKEIIMEVYNALVEKGYNPVSQLAGYILSGDPTYITSYNNARSLICKIERDVLLDEILKYYLNKEPS